MPVSRQLAVILFTDIVGYTAMMGEDEDRAIEMLQINRNIQKPLVEQYGGKWIKEMGDGVLASFSTVTDAVGCACAILKECIPVQGLELRMGIHLGEVIFEDGDVFGDGVNIASRLQAAAPIGGIWVSEAVHNNVFNKKGIVTYFVKEVSLKNVKELVRVYAVNIEQTEISHPTRGFAQSPVPVPLQVPLHQNQPKVIPKKSVAVLPFINMSNDTEQEYFSDGMAEEILNSLTHLKDLKVAGRSSSFQFKGKNVDLRKIGEKLGVQTVLEGSVRKQGNMIRVTAQLINVEDGYHIWSERYDRPYENIFAIQDEIALAITEKLKITLFEREKEIIVKSHTTNNEAYDLYLKGRFFWNKRGSALIKGLDYFQQAAEKDPEFALAFAGIADANMLIGFYDLMAPHDTMPTARKAAEKAIQLDPSCAEAYTGLAFVNMFYDWDWAGAKKNFEKVFAINPNYFLAYYWYSFYLAWVEGKFQEAIQVSLKVLELEPLLPTSYSIIWSAYVSAGKNEEALRIIRTGFELDASSFLLHYSLGMTLTALGRYDEAISVLQNALANIMRHPWLVSELCWIYSLSGDVEAAQKLFDELVLRAKTEYISGIYLFIAAYSSEKYDRAFEYMELAVEQKASFLVAAKIWPTLEAMRIDPRFHAVIKKLNLPA